MSDRKKLKGIWLCSRCPNIEATEGEVHCWDCGGVMVWHSREDVAAQFRHSGDIIEFRKPTPTDPGTPAGRPDTMTSEQSK